MITGLVLSWRLLSRSCLVCCLWHFVCVVSDASLSLGGLKLISLWRISLLIGSKLVEGPGVRQLRIGPAATSTITSVLAWVCCLSEEELVVKQELTSANYRRVTVARTPVTPPSKVQTPHLLQFTLLLLFFAFSLSCFPFLSFCQRESRF